MHTKLGTDQDAIRSGKTQAKAAMVICKLRLPSKASILGAKNMALTTPRALAISAQPKTSSLAPMLSLITGTAAEKLPQNRPMAMNPVTGT